MRFYVIENASIESRPYDGFDALSTVHTKKLQVRKRLHVVTTYRLNSMYMLQTHAPDIFSVILTIYMSFHFDPISRGFSSLCFFDENAQPF